MTRQYPWGAPGTLVPGSKYVRAYCPVCGDPMRVSKETFRSGLLLPCSRCDGHTPTTLGYEPPEDDCTGLQANAIRYLEGTC